jgi:hypothetical protein
MYLVAEASLGTVMPDSCNRAYAQNGDRRACNANYGDWGLHGDARSRFPYRKTRGDIYGSESCGGAAATSAGR